MRFLWQLKPRQTAPRPVTNLEFKSSKITKQACREGSSKLELRPEPQLGADRRLSLRLKQPDSDLDPEPEQ